MNRAFAAGVAVVLGLIAGAGLAQPDPLASLDGRFSANQAARGGQVFAGQCAACHTPLQAASLMLERSAGLRLADYHARLSRLMPPQSETRPSPAQFLDIIAYLAREAGARPGAQEASLEAGPWREAVVGVGARPRQSRAADAPTQEWASWRGSAQGLGYSPAAQIDRSNVGQLKIAL